MEEHLGSLRGLRDRPSQAREGSGIPGLPRTQRDHAFPRRTLPVVPTLLLCLPVLIGGCGEPPPNDGGAEESDPLQAPAIDQRSYSLGSIGAFAEMVDAGVKTLALSAALVPDQMDGLVAEARRIAGDHNVKIFRETDFLVTDLFPADITAGKEVLLIYRGDTLERYLALKEEKRTLVEAGEYEGEPRLEIARQFGGLLSYSDKKIQELLEGGLIP